MKMGRQAGSRKPMALEEQDMDTASVGIRDLRTIGITMSNTTFKSCKHILYTLEFSYACCHCSCRGRLSMRSQGLQGLTPRRCRISIVSRSSRTSLNSSPDLKEGAHDLIPELHRCILHSCIGSHVGCWS